MSNSGLRRFGILLLGCFLVLLAPACELNCPRYETAVCGELLKPIERFEVTITTGDEGTDRDVSLCLVFSDGDHPCIVLDETLHDDFEKWQTDTFNISAGRTVEPGDLLFFEIELDGGGVFDTNWEIVALTLLGITADNETILLYDEQRINCGSEIEAGDSYEPMDCEY